MKASKQHANLKFLNVKMLKKFQKGHCALRVGTERSQFKIIPSEF